MKAQSGLKPLGLRDFGVGSRLPFSLAYSADPLQALPLKSFRAFNRKVRVGRAKVAKRLIPSLPAE